MSESCMENLLSDSRRTLLSEGENQRVCAMRDAQVCDVVHRNEALHSHLVNSTDACAE